MKEKTKIKLKDLIKKVDYARGTPEFEKWVCILLAFLDGLLSK